MKGKLKKVERVVYPAQDPAELDKAGGYYVKHVAAMTTEGLHGKGEIAEQLAMRDKRIDELEAKLKDAESYPFNSATRDILGD